MDNQRLKCDDYILYLIFGRRWVLNCMYWVLNIIYKNYDHFIAELQDF